MYSARQKYVCGRGIWHIPLYGPAGFVVPLILAFFYTWLYNRTGAVLICLLLHASFTPAQNLFTLAATPARSGGGGPADSIDLVILSVYIAAELCLTVATRGRLGLKSAQTDVGNLRAD
ncbi:CPBP family intramembrane glutamic endopeptidase [Arthrobacter polaris]|uniref:CPBP family intramembrane glutamic endopeptidase n=1 Tax=Arthrobacter polaris TaxID=2813727 RepID=UPI002AFF5978|nr:CPBP family intramembrane glutamic endopeptidase [Arthrobacter polaris]UIK89802.1 CPBP family intramembrane metalloprotease [Arthrobacter polaris]